MVGWQKYGSRWNYKKRRMAKKRSQKRGGKKEVAKKGWQKRGGRKEVTKKRWHKKGGKNGWLEKNVMRAR